MIIFSDKLADNNYVLYGQSFHVIFRQHAKRKTVEFPSNYFGIYSYQSSAGPNVNQTTQMITAKQFINRTPADGTFMVSIVPTEPGTIRVGNINFSVSPRSENPPVPSPKKMIPITFLAVGVLYILLSKFQNIFR